MPFRLTFGREAVVDGRPVSQRARFGLHVLQGNADAKEKTLSHRALNHMLEALYQMNVDYLRAYPQTPRLYQAGIHYMEEPPGQEEWQDIATVRRMGYGDCLPLDTLVLDAQYQLKPLADVRVGERIMGDGEFTRVKEAAVTGVKPILAFALSNGCVLRASPEHRLFRMNGEELRAKDVCVGERLLSPTKAFPEAFPGAVTSIDPRLDNIDAAWLVGTYVADGWYEHTRFAISGCDKNPKKRKAEQKLRVKRMCQEAGISFRWGSKAITVNDGALTSVLAECGAYAPEKKLPRMSWSKAQVAALLEGLQTDASTANSGTLTHGTTSPILALQLRVLYRMLDQSVHIRMWTPEQHRGLGQHGMYRIGVRRHPELIAEGPRRTTARNRHRSVKVVGITKLDETLCADLTTDSGKFYLPESDLVVHNCEDLASWLAAERTVKDRIPSRPVFIEIGKRPDGATLYHIVVRRSDGVTEDPSKVLGMR